MQDLLEQQLKRAQDRMKHQADKRRTDREFQVGDMVFLRLQPFIQTSVAQRPYQKLAFRYYGPYKIEARVGKVAYKLLLPETSKIHLVVHVSQLKQAIGVDTLVSGELPPSDDVLQATQEPLCVLDSREVTSNGAPVQRNHVQWRDWPASLATWEDPGDLQRRFSTSPAWGQAGLPGGRMSRLTVAPQAQELRRTT